MIISSKHSGKKLALLAVFLLVFASSGAFHALSKAAAAETTLSAGKIDDQRLLGHWLRPDGGVSGNPSSRRSAPVPKRTGCQ
jgi:hypothetical protein